MFSYRWIIDDFVSYYKSISHFILVWFSLIWFGLAVCV